MTNAKIISKKQDSSSLEQEQKRIADILSGNLNPISVSLTLKEGEKAYYEFSTVRMADHENAVSYSKGEVRQKEVVQRAVVGGALAGPVGAVIGGLTGKQETNSTTVNLSRNEPIDKGTMILTDKRLFFVGNQIVSIDLDDIVCVHFPQFVRMEVQYPGKIKGEAYTIPNKEVVAYYKGLMRLLGKNKKEVIASEAELLLPGDRIIVPINSDDSVTCPSCETSIKEYKERWGLFSKTRVYTCSHCGQIILK